MKFRTNYNKPAELEPKGEFNLLPSLAVPDQALSLRKLLQDYTNGIPLMGFVPQFDEDDDELAEEMSRLRNMDFFDRHEALKSVNQRIIKQQAEIQRLREEEEAKRLDKKEKTNPYESHRQKEDAVPAPNPAGAGETPTQRPPQKGDR